ncbi:hypothetical protein AB832_05035 [Flavobacteriaceae bacterium (ex Bugula neritina AB1)]|nr:hypothetical protein AB832_05035 [Flavobacteriaceae bacterium (ex Bugula neritina AB1)]
MKHAKVFKNNLSQSVRIPKDKKFNDDVKQVAVRVFGEDRILSPVKNKWKDFFSNEEYRVAEDDQFSRGSQESQERAESFD